MSQVSSPWSKGDFEVGLMDDNLKNNDVQLLISAVFYNAKKCWKCISINCELLLHKEGKLGKYSFKL